MTPAKQNRTRFHAAEARLRGTSHTGLSLQQRDWHAAQHFLLTLSSARHKPQHSHPAAEMQPARSHTGVYHPGAYQLRPGCCRNREGWHKRRCIHPGKMCSFGKEQPGSTNLHTQHNLRLLFRSKVGALGTFRLLKDQNTTTSSQC